MSQNAWPSNVSLDISKWSLVTYSKIKPNTLKQRKMGLEIIVNNSSSALVYKFPQPVKIRNIKIKAQLKGNLNYKRKAPGSKNADDFPLRLGIILKGKKTLNFIQKTIAPNWLIKLDKMASNHGGFKSIYSLIFHTNKPLFHKRKHPLSPYFIEQIGGKFNHSKLNVLHSYKETYEIIGLWISSDGDDTNSSYKVIINELSVIGP